jgi:hypothetical protein
MLKSCKSLSTIVITSALAASLTCAEQNKPTSLQIFGFGLFPQGLILNEIGSKLISNGYGGLNLKNTQRGLHTPQAIRRLGRLGIFVGASSITSPLICFGVEQLIKRPKAEK